LPRLREVGRDAIEKSRDVGGRQPLPGLRAILRDATQDVHERLHHHPGFAAVQAAHIGLCQYRALLTRLLGFHAPFEAAVGAPPERSGWLMSDLDFLGARRAAPAPHCLYLPRLDTPERRIGALYVVEGSALGGRELAKRLDGLLGADAVAGRRFLLGRGADTGAAWRAYLARLESFANLGAARRDIVAAALETFAAFEQWLDGWELAQ
jgi:heme oxygenase